MQQNIIGTVAGHKNWGEIVSIAFAKAVGINYFLSDESGLQEIIDEHINLDMEGTDDIRVIRVEDFFEWMKDAGVERKVIKLAWLFYENLKDHTTKKWLQGFLHVPRIILMRCYNLCKNPLEKKQYDQKQMPIL
ncbi:MAG: hypothetical protein ABFD18_11110 [Syntrophomonas sp.]